MYFVVFVDVVFVTLLLGDIDHDRFSSCRVCVFDAARGIAVHKEKRGGTAPARRSGDHAELVPNMGLGRDGDHGLKQNPKRFREEQEGASGDSGR